MSEVTVKDIPLIHGVGIRRTCKQSEIGQVLPELYGKLFAWVPMNGGTPAGPPCSLYYDWRESDCNLAAFVPVSSAMEGEGEVEAMTLGGGPSAVYELVGPYDKLIDAHNACQAYFAQNSLPLPHVVWEQYMTNPESTPADQNRTMVCWPISK